MLALTAVIAGYFLVTGATTALQSRQLSEREDRLQAEISDVQERYQRLEALRQYLDSNEYTEAVARRARARLPTQSRTAAPGPAP